KAEVSTSGETPVLADMLPDWLGRETIGRGWGLSVADHLAFVCGGVLWVTGSGDWREFQNQPHSDEIYSDGEYISPPEDFGTLVTIGAPMTGIIDSDGSTRAFAYTGGLLTRDQWAPYDVTFGYSGDLLASVGQGQGTIYSVVPAAATGGQGAIADALSDVTTY